MKGTASGNSEQSRRRTELRGLSRSNRLKRTYVDKAFGQTLLSNWGYGDKGDAEVQTRAARVDWRMMMAQQRHNFAFYRLGGARSIGIESDDCRRDGAGVVTTTCGGAGFEVFLLGDAVRVCEALRLAGLDGGKGTLAGLIALVWGPAADEVARTAGLGPVKFGSWR